MNTNDWTPSVETVSYTGHGRRYYTDIPEERKAFELARRRKAYRQLHSDASRLVRTIKDVLNFQQNADFWSGVNFELDSPAETPSDRRAAWIKAADSFEQTAINQARYLVRQLRQLGRYNEEC